MATYISWWGFQMLRSVTASSLKLPPPYLQFFSKGNCVFVFEHHRFVVELQVSILDLSAQTTRVVNCLQLSISVLLWMGYTVDFLDYTKKTFEVQLSFLLIIIIKKLMFPYLKKLVWLGLMFWYNHSKLVPLNDE